MHPTSVTLILNTNFVFEDETTNGVAEGPATTESKAEENLKDEDTEMKDDEADDADESVVNPNLLTNGTPVSTRKASVGSSKKKSYGVPEHKTKKLNKKKSRPELRLDCKPGELYLARLKGHPPWPAIIADEEMLPESLLKSRPITTALPDGTFRKPEYADGGKRSNERTFPLMFLHTNEFAWVPNTDLKPIAAAECKEIEEKGKSKLLIAAYEVAAQDHPLSYYKQLLTDYQTALQEEEEAKAEAEAEKAKKAASKSKRKSTDAIDEDDKMEVDGEGESKPKSKKRKKSIDNDGNEKVWMSSVLEIH
jgi:hypothetical protein